MSRRVDGHRGGGAVVAGDPSPARLLFLGQGAERTGPPILLGHLLRALAADGGYASTVVAARGGPLLQEYRRSATTLAVSRGSEPLGALSAGLRRAGAPAAAQKVQARWLTHRLGRLERPDLIYVNGATPPTARLLDALGDLRGVPVLLHVHELDVGLRLTLDERDRAMLLRQADHVIAVSEPVASLLRDGHGVPADRLTTCLGFVDVCAVDPLPSAPARRLLGVPANAPVVGSVGLPDWRKAPEHLLQAVWHLRRQQPGLDPWVVWVGGDPASDDGRRLADEARRVGLAERFRHVAHCEQPTRLLGGFDVFALPAREDAFPLAALEASAAVLPLVCFDAGGIAALARRGAGLVAPYPDVAAFGAALGTLLVDPGRRAALGETGQRIVRADHDLAPGAARIRAVIDRLLAGRRA